MDSDRRTALDPSRPFTRTAALAAGIAPRRLRSNEFQVVLRGVYVDARVPLSAWTRVAAALSIHPSSAFASHSRATRILGIPVPIESIEHISGTVPGHRRQRSEIVCHVARRDAEVVVVDGVRVSSRLRTFVELAGHLAFQDLVVAGDALVRRFDIRSRELVDFCANYDGHHAALARRAARFVREEVDSPMETRVRKLIVLAGLPDPKVNFKIRDEHGAVIMRFDLSYPGLKIAVEYDGRQHAEDPQRRIDIERRERLDNEGVAANRHHECRRLPRTRADTATGARPPRGARLPGSSSETVERMAALFSGRP